MRLHGIIASSLFRHKLWEIFNRPPPASCKPSATDLKRCPSLLKLPIIVILSHLKGKTYLLTEVTELCLPSPRFVSPIRHLAEDCTGRQQLSASGFSFGALQEAMFRGIKNRDKSFIWFLKLMFTRTNSQNTRMLKNAVTFICSSQGSKIFLTNLISFKSIKHQH